jgi:CRP-like cAMP-binding protein
MQPTRDLLRNAEIFSGLDTAALELLASVAQQREIEAGGFLYKQGDPRQATYVIVEGRIELVREGGDRKSTRLNSSHPD